MRRTLTALLDPTLADYAKLVLSNTLPDFMSDVIYLPESSSKIQLSRYLLTMPYGQFGIPATSTQTMSSQLNTTPLGVVSVVHLVPTLQQS
jgi:hypothetical protein